MTCPHRNNSSYPLTVINPSPSFLQTASQVKENKEVKNSTQSTQNKQNIYKLKLSITIQEFSIR